MTISLRSASQSVGFPWRWQAELAKAGLPFAWISAWLKWGLIKRSGTGIMVVGTHFSHFCLLWFSAKTLVAPLPTSTKG